MTTQCTYRIVSPRLWAVMLCGLGLTGCPLTDKYYIEQSSAGGAVGEGGIAGNTSAMHSGGAAGTSAGGVFSTAGAGTGIGTAGSTGTATVDCDVATCSGTCCDNVCVDLQTDRANCSQCGSACPVGRNCRAGACYGWTSMTTAPAALVAREKAAYVVMGTKLFIFGGLDGQGNALNTGAIYDKTTDSWTMLPQTTNVPSPRQLASAFWTGVRVYVIGGRDSASALAYADGARFDPDSNAWLTVSSLPTGRVAPWGAPGPNSILVWGGLSASDMALSGGERSAYSGGTTTNNWVGINAGMGGTTPDRVTEATWGYTDSLAYLFGGRTNGTTKSSKGFLYNVNSNGWSAIPTGPSARWGSFGTCDGTAFYLWGGRDDSTVMSDGYRYGAAWTTLGLANAPSARWAPYRRTGWAFAFSAGDIAILGGMDLAGNPLIDGGRYNRTTDTWTSISAWPSQEAHDYGVAALIDGEIFVWGGRNGATLTTTGERWSP